MTTLNFLKQTKNYLGAALLFTALSANAQTDNSLPTDNPFVEGVALEFFFAQQPDNTPGRVTFAANILDGDDDTDWAANTNVFSDAESFIIVDLKGAYDLAEVQLLTLAKNDPYTYDIHVSTTGIATGDFTDAFTAADKGAITGFLESNLDGTYKSFVLPSVIEGARYVKVFNYGRIDIGGDDATTFTTISELKFYGEASATASTRDNTLSEALIYPNPAKGTVNVSGVNDKVSKVEVVSLEGKVVASKKVENSNENLSIDTSRLTNGVYFLNFTNAGAKSNSSKTIVIQN